MLRLCDIHAALGGVLHGDGTRAIAGLASLESAGPDRLAFVGQARHAAAIESTQAAALIVPPELVPRASARGPCIETSQPYPYFARLTQWWRSRQLAAQRAAAEPAEPAIHPSAWVHPSAELAAGVRLGAFAVVEAGAQIGAGSEIGAHCVIGARARIGAQARLAVQVVIGHDCTLGARCIVHSGAVIGADGFGFAAHEERWLKIEQLGAVRIGDEVEIGANTCIDRGTLDDTVLEDGVKLDNLIQIGHNVRIGAHTAMAGCVGVAGSAQIGGTVDCPLPALPAIRQGIGIHRDIQLAALFAHQLQALLELLVGKIQAGEMTGIGVVTKAGVDGIRTLAYGGFEGRQAACGTHQLHGDSSLGMYRTAG